MLRTNLTAQDIDDALAGTFPASDPPAWTPGIARPAPEIAGVIDVSGPTHEKRTFAQALVSLLGAAGLTLLAPAAVLAVGIPVALAVRGLLEAARWVATIIR
jgi:hypothetical protein